MALNPDCTPGWADDQFEDDGTFRAFCGCGWTEPGFPSKSAALRAQKEHRFPGPNPAEQPDAVSSS